MLISLLSMVEESADKAKFGWLYATMRHKMYRVARALLPTEEDAQDAVQESFLKIIKNFSKISTMPRKEMEPYVVTIVENTAKDMLRKKKRQHNVSLTDWDWAPAEEDPAESQYGYEAMVELILEMPESHRDILYLSCVEEESCKRIARRLDLTEGQVTGRLHRGKNALRKRLREEGYGNDREGI